MQNGDATHRRKDRHEGGEFKKLLSISPLNNPSSQQVSFLYRILCFSMIDHLQCGRRLPHTVDIPCACEVIPCQQHMNTQERQGFFDKRGPKQGDPVSSLLFNTGLQFALEDDLKRWQEKHTGIPLSDKKQDCLTNLRFADDVLLFSTSLNKLKEMLCDFEKSTEKVGLEIHQ